MTDYLARPAGQIPPRWAEVHDEISLWASRFGALLFDCLELKPIRDGLDVACGTGFPLIELAQVHGASSQWIGIDIWTDALERARRKIEVLGVRNATVKEADAASMPFADRSFDLITSNLGINNFADLPAVMRECARVARPEACLVLTTNITGHMAEMYDILRAVARDHVAAIDHQERHRGTLESISKLLSHAGFSVARTVRRDFALKFVDGSAMLRHSFMRWFIDDWRVAIGRNDEREVFAEVERRLNERGPLQLTIPALYIEAVRR